MIVLYHRSILISINLLNFEVMLYSGETVFLKSTDNAEPNVLCRQINVKSARKLYDLGVKIWLHPCNLTLNNAWQVPYHYQKSETNTECFDSLVNSFRYYNCDRQRGKRIIFFAKCDKMGKLLHS